MSPSRIRTVLGAVYLRVALLLLAALASLRAAPDAAPDGAQAYGPETAARQVLTRPTAPDSPAKLSDAGALHLAFAGSVRTLRATSVRPGDRTPHDPASSAGEVATIRLRTVGVQVLRFSSRYAAARAGRPGWPATAPPIASHA